MRIVREFRNISMFKQAGRAHDPSGIEGTGDGDLALRCYACPRPGFNLPVNYKEEPEATSYGNVPLTQTVLTRRV